MRNFASRVFRCKPKYLTLDEAIKQGIVDPAALQRHYIPKSGVSVKFWLNMPDEQGRLLMKPHVQVYFPSWRDFRNNLRAIYMGGAPLLATRDIPTGMREPIIDIGAGVTDIEYRAARGLLLDKGLVQGPEE